MTITVYGSALSPFSRKVLVFLEEKGIAYENEQISPFGPPDWFAEISPMGKIPVLRDTAAGPDGTLPDSSIICAYLEDSHRQPALYPSDPFERARASWLEEYADTALSAVVGGPFFYALVVRRLMGQEADRETAEANLKNDVPSRFAYLDEELAGKEFFAAAAFSIADIAVASQLVNFKFAGGEIDPGLYPNLAAFAERVHARPSFAKFIEAGQGMLDKALN